MMRSAIVNFDNCQLDVWQEYDYDSWDEEGNAHYDNWHWAVEVSCSEDKTEAANDYLRQTTKSLGTRIKQDDVDFGEHYLVAFMGVLTQHKIDFTTTVDLL